MFASRQRGTVIAKGLKIVGSVTAEGLVEVNGQIDGELHCTSLAIARGAQVNGTVAAERVVVDGNVEGPIHGGDVILKSKARVVGDIHHHLLPSNVVPSSKVVRCNLEKTAKGLRGSNQNHRKTARSLPRASPKGLNGSKLRRIKSSVLPNLGALLAIGNGGDG